MDDGIETFTMMKLWMPNHVLSTKSEHEKFQKLIRKNNEIMDTEMQFRRINLIMPRFSIETKQDLKNTFLDLGMNEVFNDGFHFDPLFGKDNYSPASVRYTSMSLFKPKSPRFLKLTPGFSVKLYRSIFWSEGEITWKASI